MHNILLGTSGITAAQVVNTVPTDGTPATEIIKIVVQLVIGLATLIGLWKKNKQENKK